MGMVSLFLLEPALLALEIHGALDSLIAKHALWEVVDQLASHATLARANALNAQLGMVSTPLMDLALFAVPLLLDGALVSHSVLHA